MRRYSLTILVDRDLISRAKSYFEQQVKYNPGAYQYSDEKEWMWDNAYTISVAGQHGVIIPLKNGRAFLGTIHQVNCEVNVLVSSTYNGPFHSELVRLVPHNPDCIGAFTGFIMPANTLVRNMRPVAFDVSSNKRQYGGGAALVDVSTSTGYGMEGEEESTAKGERSFTLIGGNNVIGNIKDYCKCFDNNPGNDHKYEVMLCVSQPVPNSRDPWGFSKKHHAESGNPVCVGHTFLIMKEKTPNKTVIRNVGFYPSGFVWPYKPMEQGELVNDSYHDYNIALTITVTSHQFTSILNFIYQGNDKGFMYNLNSNNCTTFALNALGVANIKITRTTGYWKGGSGLNPGDLGEDLRIMQLKSNMKLITVYEVHGNQGNCY